ncbi:MAG: response regulator receiver modulated metal dependent phosphohydrolase [Actinobacteria bacterium]|nr:response regulator receiver modulated metal dependent phosphohydrolase [Actinomycetota bacterium]
MSSEPREKILMVDDDAQVVGVIGQFLSSQGFRFHGASNGREGIEKAKELHPDLVFLDLSMPGMDGFEVCRRLKGDPATVRIPVVILTAYTEIESRIKALKAGATDFLAKPIDFTELLVRTENILQVKRYQDFLEEHSRILENKVQERTRQFKEAMLDTAQRLTLASEYRDVDTFNHVKRIGFYAEVLAREVGIATEEADILSHASRMHDIGKVGIPDSILLKQGELTRDEFEIIKTHTTIGARILKGSSSPYLQAAEVIALTHHERWDGSGYPQGLKGEKIPIGGRIVYLADVYDALRSKRPYKPSFEHENAVEMLACKGPIIRPGHIDQDLLLVFHRSAEQFREIFESYPSL